MKVLAAGVALTCVVTLGMWLAWGMPAVVPGGVFGGMATAIQVASVRLAVPAVSAPYVKFLRRWAMGVALRMAGVVLFVAAVVVDRVLFPPLATAFAYLGVLIPLLFAEAWFIRDARNA